MPLPTITVQQLEEFLPDTSKYFLLDVRQPEEFAEARIDGSTLIPLGVLPIRFNELEPHKNKEILVHCRSGARSAQAAQFLIQQGYSAHNVAGGILAWAEMMSAKDSQ